jgi:cyclic pyranopterin phosphate synthase
MSGLCDSWHRQISYLRLSVTDHCNLSCLYCSASSVPRLPRSEVLSFEEIRRVVQIGASLGINKVRITGGEPLLRSNLSELVRMISRIDGIDDISLTSNGILLKKYAIELKEAGLNRVNISLDTLREDRFKRITRVGRLSDVLAGIEAAHQAGLNPVKLNMVVLRGINDDETIDFAKTTIDKGWHVRFIELMPFGTPEAGALKPVSGQEIRERLRSLGELEPCEFKTGNGPAKYYRLPGAEGTIGFITPITEPFCTGCNRIRLTADGQLRPCLLSDEEVDLKSSLRNHATNEDLKNLILQAVAIKREGHHLNESHSGISRPMCQIGG